MPPYGRDAGMTESQAQAVATTLRGEVDGAVFVEREGRYFVVRVDAEGGVLVVRDAVDVRWLRRQPPRASAAAGPTAATTDAAPD